MEENIIIFRKMKKQDIVQVAKIEKTYLTTPWSLKEIEDSFARENYIFIVAEKNGSIIGYIGLYFILEEGNITNILVEESHRGQGIGTNLLTNMIQAAKIQGVTSVTLEVRASNEQAMRIYDHNGFEKEGTRKDYYSNPKEDAIIMWKYNI